MELKQLPDLSNQLNVYFKFGPNEITRLKAKYPGLNSSQETIDYCHGLLTYSIQASDNMQRLTRSVTTGYLEMPRAHIVASQTDVLPNHLFPSTQAIDDKAHYLKARVKPDRKNHRLTLHLETRLGLDENKNKDVAYLSYSHDADVDIDKMNQSFQDAYHTIVAI